MEFQGNFYRCNKCSRITQGYPFGCRERQCPVKKDVTNDWFYGTFVGIIILVLFYAGIYVLYRKFSIPPTVRVEKRLDFYPEPRYTK